jgi:hypothetical protein
VLLEECGGDLGVLFSGKTSVVRDQLDAERRGRGRLFSASNHQFSCSGAQRRGDATVAPVVNLTATPQGPVGCYAVVEKIPPGLTPSGLSGDGIWDPIAGAIRWGPYLDNQLRGFSYSVAGLSGPYLLSGLVSFDGFSLSTGMTVVQINTSVTSPATLLISNILRNTDGSVTLNIVGLPNVTNRVWANTNLALPAGWQPIFTNPATPANGIWQFIDTNTAGLPMRFYRFSMP